MAKSIIVEHLPLFNAVLCSPIFSFASQVLHDLCRKQTLDVFTTWKEGFIRLPV